MRKISGALKSDIEDAATAELLANLPVAVAEKDVHITDALVELANIKIFHDAYRVNRRKGDASPGKRVVESRLVFAGGTCLSKAQGLIERMSEDIDIKVILDDIPDGYALAQGHTNRKRLGDIQKEVFKKLKDIGFSLAEVEDESNPISRDNRRYYRLALKYQPEFIDVAGVLRSELKVELIHRSPRLPVETIEMGYLLDRFVKRDSAPRFSMLCISVAETLAEKVLSLLRRCAWKWDGCQRGEFDSALVRHIYDVWRIHTSSPKAINAAHPIFADIVATDVDEFGVQHPEFAKAPYRVLRRALERATSDKGLRENFEQRLIPLLFAKEKPKFETCFESFSALAEIFLGKGCDQAVPAS